MSGDVTHGVEDDEHDRFVRDYVNLDKRARPELPRRTDVQPLVQYTQTFQALVPRAVEQLFKQNRLVREPGGPRQYVI